MKYILTALLFAGLAWSTQAYAQSRIELVPYAAELGTAVDITHAGDGRLFVARQYGAIFLVRDSMDVADIEFLDIASRVLFNGERGLLGMAFDPDFATNGHFYVNYITGTGDGISRISRFTVGPNPDVADPNSEVVLISLPQPNPIHQAGGLAFGTDGYLYCALGDGGGSDDPNNEGQDPTSLFGTILRIKPESDGTYSIPPDNPFVGASGDTLPEIWAYGLRNPFRFGIDPGQRRSVDRRCGAGALGRARPLARWPEHRSQFRLALLRGQCSVHHRGLCGQHHVPMARGRPFARHPRGHRMCHRGRRGLPGHTLSLPLRQAPLHRLLLRRIALRDARWARWLGG
ncbi:MAG: PQQ-dependent sugar dehydrogenase [Flavobacteriales bacterium]|nr:PQQ-dependent sugar dehydrogenase [Flavobacteriales bacterium]